MTEEKFLAFYPQFLSFPNVVTEEYVEQANARFGDFEDMAEEARRLYVAHKLTLYAQTYAEEKEGAPTAFTMKMIAGNGVAAQALSKSVGGVSVTKSESSGVASISGYGEWKQTEFGVQLISLAKSATMGGRWIP